jgi:hypothetical protein
MNLIKICVTSAIFVVVLLTGPMASAALVVTVGPGSNIGTDNVIGNNSCGPPPPIQGPATTVQGCLNTSHTTLVNFTSDENLTYTGGQAAIEAVDGVFSYLLITLAAPMTTFSKLMLNIESTVDGFVTFLGNPGGTGSSPYALSANGENKFTLTGENFTSISFFTTLANNVVTDIVSSVDLVADGKQVRIGGIQNVPINPDPGVPVPGTLLLLVLGLLSLGRSLYRSRSRA